MERVARRGGLPEADRLTGDCLRRSFATRFLKNGGNLEELRRSLGHSSLSVIQKYLQLVGDAHLRSMMEQASGTEAPQECSAHGPARRDRKAAGRDRKVASGEVGIRRARDRYYINVFWDILTRGIGD